MGITKRFFELNLPPEHCVVIGSGLLDALNLRESSDIDLVVSEELFERLRQADGWQAEVKYGETVLTKGDAEVWLSWGSRGTPNFKQLYEQGVSIDGVRFVDPVFLLNWKKDRASDKDLRDVKLLEEYLK
jgi:hypothetical protein